MISLLKRFIARWRFRFPRRVTIKIGEYELNGYVRSIKVDSELYSSDIENAICDVPSAQYGVQSHTMTIQFYGVSDESEGG